MVVEDDQAAGGGLQLLDQSTVTGARWVDVQGCCGVHGVASLCGGRVSQILTLKVILSIFMTIKDVFNVKGSVDAVMAI